MTSFGKDEPEFLARDAQILGVSRDSLDAHQRFAEKTGAQFPLLSDQGGQVAKLYGGNLPILPISARKLFVIDKHGILRAIVDGMPDNSHLLSLLDQLNSEAPAS